MGKPTPISLDRLLDCFLECSGGVSTDTRRIKPQSLFFALKGDQFDGHVFAEQAVQAGAKFVVVDNPTFWKEEDAYLFVENSLEALQGLAKFYRKKVIPHIPLVVVAGSNGKTTTKELMYSVIHRQYSTYCTPSNLNNHIGVPLSLLSVQSSHERAIIEIGANHLGEHTLLCDLAQAQIALITNCGKDHLEGYGGMDGVLASSEEIVNDTLMRGSTLILNGDDPALCSLDKKNQAYLFGKKKNVQDDHRYLAMGEVVHSFPFVEAEINGEPYISQLFGDFQLYNMLAVSALAKLWLVDEQYLKEGIAHYKPSSNRGQLVTWKSHNVLLDAYNANPSSMRVMIESMNRYDKKDKILILGDMAELGKFSLTEHDILLQSIEKNQYTAVILIGQHFYEHQHLFPSFHFFRTLEEAKSWIDQQSWKCAFMMMKGSRAMAMEKLILHDY